MSLRSFDVPMLPGLHALFLRVMGVPVFLMPCYDDMLFIGQHRGIACVC